MIYLLLDTSYVIFYRYFALMQWWKIAKKDEDLGDPSQNPEFIEKFDKLFTECISTIKKKLKINKENVCVIAARDCPRSEFGEIICSMNIKNIEYKMIVLWVAHFSKKYIMKIY